MQSSLALSTTASLRGGAPSKAAFITFPRDLLVLPSCPARVPVLPGPARHVHGLCLMHQGRLSKWNDSVHGAGPVMCCGVSLAGKPRRTGAGAGQLTWRGEEAVEVS